MRRILRSGPRLQRSRPSALALVGLLIIGMSACTRASQPSEMPASSAGWHEFTGTWIASGSRNNLRLDGDRRASVATFDGSLVLAGPSKPAVGFRAQALVFNDTATGTIGRAVWTDERGNRVFSELKGPGGAASKIVGIFVGGTGPYVGATGTYAFSWRFLVESEGGTVQGQSSGLNGRIHVASPAATPYAGGSQS